MSRYATTVEARFVERAFQRVDVPLKLEDEDVCLFFGYDYPLALYFLDVEDGTDYHEFGYGGWGFVPGKRLTKGQMLEVANGILTEVCCGRLMAFHDAVALDLPV
jgi:hypothetical protein